MSREQHNINIVIIDSGINYDSPIAKEKRIKDGIEIVEDENGTIHYSLNTDDRMGHGTAVASSIAMLVPDCYFTPIKIIDNNQVPSNELLCTALKYAYEKIDCDIINISAGIVCCNDIARLYNLCKNLCEKGVIIVSAYDNDGAISYPAAFDCVIGVDGIRQKHKMGYYIRVRGNNADFVGCLHEKRLFTISNHEVCAGNSFLTSEFVEKVVNLKKKGITSFSEIVDFLNKDADGIVDKKVYYNREIPFKIKKAIVFPFNKEMQCLARFQRMLNFEVIDFCDAKYSPNIGKKVSNICNIEDNHIVKSVNNIDWNLDFDTVILGHTSLLSDAIGFNYEDYIVELCRKYNKKLFSCRDIRALGEKLQGIEFYCPYVDRQKMPGFLKMHVVGCPVVGVVGTGSNQGKFTLQLGLRASLEKHGFRVAQIGTEPTAQLFGMECVYPMGHESSVYMQGFEAVYELNCMMGYLEALSPDIIIFGSQANTVPVHVGGSQNYPVVQHELLLGCQADAYILCVSDDAPLEYIKRTISYLEGIYSSKVIAIVLSSLAIGSRFSTISGERHFKTKIEMNEWKKEMEKEITIPICCSNEDDYYDELQKQIVSFFSNSVDRV